MPPLTSESLSFYRSLSPQSVTLLRVFGEDAFGYLQSQVSADLRASGMAWARYTLWLDACGHVLADSFVLCEGAESFLLFSYAIPAARLREVVEANIIADDVEIEVIGEGWSHWALWADAASCEAGADAQSRRATANREQNGAPNAVADTGVSDFVNKKEHSTDGEAHADAFAALPQAVCSLLPEAGRYAALSASGLLLGGAESEDKPAAASSLAAPLLFAGRNAGGWNFDLLLPPQAAIPAAFASVFTETEWSLREARRIADGIAAIPADIGEGDLPQEGGDLAHAAVSTTKGCYLGQEVIARWQATGQARSGLFRVCLFAGNKKEPVATTDNFSAEALAETGGASGSESAAASGVVSPSAAGGAVAFTAQSLPLRLYAGKKPVGELRSFSALTGSGLALLKVHRLDAARELASEPDGAPQIRVLEPMLS